MSIVKAKLQAKKAEFISLDEVLELLCQRDGCSIEEAAQYLLHLLGEHGEGIECVWSSMVHGLCIADRSSFIADIQKIAQGLHLDPWGDVNAFSSGFHRLAILSVLAKEGVNLETVTQPHKKELPQWALDCRAIRRYTQGQAARVLVGTDPIDDVWLGDEWQREIDRANMALSQAADDGVIAVASLSSNEQRIFHASDLRLWALSHGYEWPIPEIQPGACPAPVLSGSASVASGDILKRLQDSERARHELQAEVDRLKAQAAQVKQQTEGLAEQAVFIGKLQTEIAQAKTEIDRLQTEIAKGKSLSTLQKLVIAMAIDGYGYKPRDSKSPIPKQLEGITGSFEIEVTDETVLRHLRLAASTHLPGSVG